MKKDRQRILFFIHQKCIASNTVFGVRCDAKRLQKKVQTKEFVSVALCLTATTFLTQ